MCKRLMGTSKGGANQGQRDAWGCKPGMRSFLLDACCLIQRKRGACGDVAAYP